ncbi:dihydrodipicolinate synthase family protein [Rubrobacter aplysinae]|uniref:dihydrodipicolinate synthase family protein n=1 Tax=Rubrobacter aplysinae TaxID=909625 RepID=UPI00064BD9A1|nr:dihydrodipicolinate synthase family protein [Rubrobacter aplysinae]
MLDGIMPAMITPFDERGEIDPEATETVVERSISAGVDGLSILGSTGEFPHLEFEERRGFAERVIGLVNGRVKVVVGVGSASTREAEELARHAGDAGADATLCVPPFYFKLGERALFEHFSAVSRAADVPMLVYNFPLLTGVEISPEFVSRLATELPNAAGLKDTVTEHTHTLGVLNEVKPTEPDFSVLVGFEEQILPNLLAGGDGAISGLANVAPELFVGLVRSFREGDLEDAADRHRRILALLGLGGLSDPVVGAVKAAMQRLGIAVSPAVRGPALPLPRDSYAELDGILESAGLRVASV